MRSATSSIDASILPDQARQELFDFYTFLVGKYVKRHVRISTRKHAAGTAAALATSSLIGTWKDRELGDSAMFARTLREQAQKRSLT